MRTHVGVAVLTTVLLTVASPAMAQGEESGWYAGVSAGRLNADFRPYYTYYEGGTPDQFENESHGLQVEFLLGRKHRLSNRWSLSVEGSGAFNSFKWSLSTDEPAKLEYALPYRVALSVVPEVHFGRVSLYAGLGGGFGRVHELKTSSGPNISRYDYDEVRPTLNVGGGIKVRAGGFDLFGHVGQARYFGVEFDTIAPFGGMLPAERKVEHVTDKPRATGFTVGVIKRF